MSKYKLYKWYLHTLFNINDFNICSYKFTTPGQMKIKCIVKSHLGVHDMFSRGVYDKQFIDMYVSDFTKIMLLINKFISTYKNFFWSRSFVQHFRKIYFELLIYILNSEYKYGSLSFLVINKLVWVLDIVLFHSLVDNSHCVQDKS